MCKKVKRIKVKYKLGHSYKEDWEWKNLFCPNCGKKSVWEEQSGGDYYVGVQYLCILCKATFNLPSYVDISDNWQDKQRIEAIKAHITSQSTR